ncbi:hypothetical protein E4S40_04620 [Algoriphagus kandeliae]|uniref:Uncharacterized protein n=1 Tax=Algoriphagus kandeliae TaxID=2562278 RepID=A0A4Y9QTY5_9BACT|nr:hypothetical protein [Algoriphagus kandeliae]TFV95510.1 hypothetical protein E4S40_04620 [Algoriphagus kandeliae]
MSSLMINLFLAGFAYVIIIYFVAMMTKNSLKKGKDGRDDGDGGIEDKNPPQIDLPPGVIWPGDSPKKTKPEPVDY